VKTEQQAGAKRAEWSPVPEDHSRQRDKAAPSGHDFVEVVINVRRPEGLSSPTNPGSFV
jgi:hypothetical protein